MRSRLIKNRGTPLFTLPEKGMCPQFFYATFSLTHGSGVSLNVFVWGHSKVKAGQKVKVIGTYRKVKRVGRYTFYNEIEATEVKNE